MTIEEKSNLLTLISKGKVQAVIDLLLTLDLNESSKLEAIAISSRYKKLKHQNRLGILSFEQSNLTENQITAHLIELINHPEDSPFPKDKKINTTNPIKPLIWKYITAAAVVIGILGGIAELLNFINVLPINQSTEKHQLTVFVSDTDGNVVLEHQGKLNTSIGNRPLRETIGEDGRTNFGDILPEYLGDTIEIGFLAEGWEIADGNNTFVFTGEPIKLKVKRDSSLGIIKGVVKSRDGQKFIDSALVRVNADTMVFTNAIGNFKIILPKEMQVTKETDLYLLTVSKEGYNNKTQLHSPNSSDAEIRLEQNQ